MAHGREARIEELFDAAARLPPGERRHFVEESTGGDLRLRDELLALLAADDEAGSFLETPACDSSEFEFRGAQLNATLATGVRIGAYEVVRPLAAGGMGTVYEALQDQPRRSVALKVMRAGLASPSALRRFQFEAELLGRLTHPGIARIFEAGTWRDGDLEFPYFAMELVPGARTLVQHAEEERLSTRARLELMARVCDAVQHGHQRGVIHRDIKPGNLLVDATGTPKVIDFGVARATDSDVAATTLRTGVGELVGTLQYMSPEQCEADPADIDTRSDVYALGLVLYELVCGALPYVLAGEPIPRAVEIIRSSEPRRPSTVRRALRGDIETIVLKAIQKDRERRYSSAAELGADLRRYLAGEAIEAKRDSGWYVLSKTLRRHKTPVVAAAVVVIGLAAGLIVALVQRDRAVRAEVSAGQQLTSAIAARERADREAQKYARTADFLGSILDGVDPEVARDRDTTLLREVFDRAAETADTELAAAPEVQAEVRRVLGDSYLALGLFDEARVQIGAALEYYGETLGPGAPATLRAMSQLGHVHFRQRDLARSEALNRELLEILEALPEDQRPTGDEATRVEDVLANLAIVVGMRGDLKGAEELLRRCLDVRRSTFGRDDWRSVTTAHNLASMLAQSGRWEESAELFVETLADAREGLGDTHPTTLTVMRQAVSPLVMTGRLEEAERLAEESLDLHVRVLKEEHVDTLGALFAMANVLEAQGRWEDAQPLRADCFARARERLTADHPTVLVYQGVWGKNLTKLGRFDEAEAQLLDAYERLRASLGDAHFNTAHVRANLAELYEAWGQPERAVGLR